jgi:hypothetical protein
VFTARYALSPYIKQICFVFKGLNNYLATLFSKLIEEDQTPEWLTAGVTLFIPKNENTEKLENYRPITCLPVIYKLITSLISKRMQRYIDDQNLMLKEQKGCCRGSKGC